MLDLNSFKLFLKRFGFYLTEESLDFLTKVRYVNGVPLNRKKSIIAQQSLFANVVWVQQSVSLVETSAKLSREFISSECDKSMTFKTSEMQAHSCEDVVKNIIVKNIWCD